VLTLYVAALLHVLEQSGRLIPLPYQ
jgi:hypothetical protein